MHPSALRQVARIAFIVVDDGSSSSSLHALVTIGSRRFSGLAIGTGWCTCPIFYTKSNAAWLLRTHVRFCTMDRIYSITSRDSTPTTLAVLVRAKKPCNHRKDSRFSGLYRLFTNKSKTVMQWRNGLKAFSTSAVDGAFPMASCIC